MDIVIILLIIRFIVLPIFAFISYSEDFELSLNFCIITLIPISGDLFLIQHLKEIYYERRNKRNKLS